MEVNRDLNEFLENIEINNIDVVLNLRRIDATAQRQNLETYTSQLLYISKIK